MLVKAAHLKLSVDCGALSSPGPLLPPCLIEEDPPYQFYPEGDLHSLFVVTMSFSQPSSCSDLHEQLIAHPWRQLCLVMCLAGPPLSWGLPNDFCPLCLVSSALRFSCPKASTDFQAQCTASGSAAWPLSAQRAFSPGRVDRSCCSTA